MSAPQLTVSADGVGTVGGDQLNTYCQTCDTMSDLRAFVGIQGIQVFVRGTSAPNDGGQGNFYWNANATAPDDNGVTTVVPFGSGSGAWTRINALTTTVRQRLTGATTYYVNTVSGSNSTGNGTASLPWQSLQFAYNTLVATIDAGDNAVSIDVTGVDSGGLIVDVPVPGAGAIGVILHNGINTTANAGIAVSGNGRISVSGAGTVQGAAFDIEASFGGYILVQGITTGPCSTYKLYSFTDGIIAIVGNYGDTGAAAAHWRVESNGTLAVTAASTLTLTGTPAYALAFAVAETNGTISAPVGLISFAGSGATGLRYDTSTAGGIDTNAGGATFLPGSIAGTTTAPGWYN